MYHTYVNERTNKRSNKQTKKITDELNVSISGATNPCMNSIIFFKVGRIQILSIIYHT